MQFKTSNNVYTGGYTSEIIRPNTSGPTALGLIQAQITSGDLTLQGRVSEDAPWVTVKVFTDAEVLEYLVLVPYFRVIASDAAEAWLEELR